MKPAIKIFLDLTAAVISLFVVVWVVFVTSLQSPPLVLFVTLITLGVTALLALFFVASLYGEKEPLMALALVSFALFFINALSYEHLGVEEQSIEDYFRFFLTAYWGVFSSLTASFMLLLFFDTWESLLKKSILVYTAVAMVLFVYALLKTTISVAGVMVIAVPCVAVPLYLVARLRWLRG